MSRLPRMCARLGIALGVSLLLFSGGWSVLGWMWLAIGLICALCFHVAAGPLRRRR
jgi:hypothetical protein